MSHVLFYYFCQSTNMNSKEFFLYQVLKVILKLRLDHLRGASIIVALATWSHG